MERGHANGIHLQTRTRLSPRRKTPAGLLFVRTVPLSGNVFSGLGYQYLLGERGGFCGGFGEAGRESQVRNGEITMMVSIQGVYRNGKIELVEPPENIPNETFVIVTFLEHGLVDLA